MANPKAKAAIDCVGFICQLQNSVDLILADVVTDPEAIDGFNKMKEACQKNFDRWVEAYDILE